MSAAVTVARWSLLLALGLSLYGILAASLGFRRQRPEWIASSRAAVLGVFQMPTGLDADRARALIADAKARALPSKPISTGSGRSPS